MTKTRIGMGTVFAASILLSASANGAAVTYKVEPTHTYAHIQYKHLGFSTQILRFDTVSGTVILDVAAKTGEVDIKVDTGSISSGLASFDAHLNGKDYLDTTAYPEASFTSSSIKFDGDMPVSAQGELTIKGISKPVTLSISSFAAKTHPMLGKEAIGADGVIKIKRSEFNAGMNVPAVSDETVLILALEAIAQ